MRSILYLFLTGVMLAVSLTGVVSPEPVSTVQADGGAETASACAELTVENPSSEACEAEIVANPVPELEAAVEYDAQRDGKGHPRSVYLPEEPLPYPIAWQKRAWYFADAPGVLPAADDWTNARRIGKYTMYYIYHYVEVNNVMWYLIGPNQWMSQEFVSVLQIPERPEGVTGPWVAVDITQQTLVAFEDDIPIYATLVSTGYWILTETGLFQLYARTSSMTMQGPPGANPPEYVLPHVPWVMFFNEHEALHGAAYHNYFGMKRSHGCVNLAPGDAEWVWNFFEQTIENWHPSRSEDFFVDNPDAAPWVYIYESPEYPELPQW